nr:DNA polymerase III subunit beta [Geodermatophilaceae bacterium]
WTARSLPARPPVPVLAGLVLSVEGDTLEVSGFDYEVSTQAQLPVHAASAGRSLVSGRLLADITKSLPPHPVDVAVDGPRLSINCGNARFSLPTLPVEDYPALPTMPSTAGTVQASVFAEAVGQVAIAAGRDDTLPMLTGVRIEIEGETITLVATDRFRLALREFTWEPGTPGASSAILVPARTLADAAKTLTGGSEVTVSLSTSGVGEGLLGLSGQGKQTTTRLLDAEFLKYRSILPPEFSSHAELDVAAFTEAAKRVALVAERWAPLRCEFSSGAVTLRAGGDEESHAEERCEVVFDGETTTIGFNPAFLLDGLAAVHSETARLEMTTPLKPAVLSAMGGDSDAASYRYLIMPVRLPS